MSYTPDPETGLLTEEYVDVYGIPFSVIPFKGPAHERPRAGRQAEKPRPGTARAGTFSDKLSRR